MNNEYNIEVLLFLVKSGHYNYDKKIIIKPQYYKNLIHFESLLQLTSHKNKIVNHVRYHYHRLLYYDTRVQIHFQPNILQNKL